MDNPFSLLFLVLTENPFRESQEIFYVKNLEKFLPRRIEQGVFLCCVEGIIYVFTRVPIHILYLSGGRARVRCHQKQPVKVFPDQAHVYARPHGLLPHSVIALLPFDNNRKERINWAG